MLFFFMIAAAVAAETIVVDEHGEVSLLQLRGSNRDLVGKANESVFGLWPQTGPPYRKCADQSGHKVPPEVTECGTSMIDIDIANAEIEGEQYVGGGPGVEFQWADPSKPGLHLRYKNVAVYEGISLDLKVVNMDEDYDPGLKKVKLGVTGNFGVVSVRTNKKATFKFSMVKSGTDVEIRVPEIPVTLYDVDGGKHCAMREAVFANGYIFGKIGDNLVPTKEALNISGGFINKFPPNMYKEASIDTPGSPQALDPIHKSISASFVFANTASFNVQFDATVGFNDEYLDIEPQVTKCGTDIHGRWMIFSMEKLPCSGSYLSSEESAPEGHPEPIVEDQEACQKLAEENGHPYYSFEPNQKKCFTSAQCFEPIDTTPDNEPWKIFVELWPKHNNTNVACKSVDGAPTVHSELKCQDLAIERGHRFYSFLETTNQCVTSYDCNNDDGFNVPPFLDDPWRIREEPWWQWGSSNRKCHPGGGNLVASQWSCQRLAWSLRHGFYSYQQSTSMCMTSETCDTPVQTDPEDDWRIHIDRWPINGDPGDGLCGDGEFLEKIGLGDGADCQTLCANDDVCKHYCYKDGGNEGNCRTYGLQCSGTAKTGGSTEDGDYTCYDKPPDLYPTTIATTPMVSTVPPTINPIVATTAPTTTWDDEFIQFEFPPGGEPTTPPPTPAPPPGVIEECCGSDVEVDALAGDCFTKITDLPLDSLHGRDASETFGDNVYLGSFKYYLETCPIGLTEDCTYTELTDPDPQHHNFRVGKTRVKIEAHDIAGNKYECMRNVYVHDMQPPSFVYETSLVDTTTGETSTTTQQFVPESTSVRHEVDKTTCNTGAEEVFARYENLQGLSGMNLMGADNCDIVRTGDSIGTEVVKKIYDSSGTLIYDSSSEEFNDESLITGGPGTYKMEIIAIDDYSDGIEFPSNRSADMHETVLLLDLELYDEEPPGQVSACPADMTGDREVVIGPNETEGAVFWEPPNVTFDNCEHHQPPPPATCVVDNTVDGVDPTSGEYTEGCHPGMKLKVGSHVIVYTFTDGYGNPPGGIECEFRVHIVQEEHPVTLTCPEDITITTLPMREFAIVMWDPPVAMQNGEALPGSHVSYPQGVASGMPFPFGVTEITVRAEGHDFKAVKQGNQLLQWDECIFRVTVTDEENPKCDGREFRCNAAGAAAYPPMLKPYDICDGPQLMIELRPSYPTNFSYRTVTVDTASGDCCDSELDVAHVCTAIEGTGTSYCAPSPSS